MPDRDPVYQEDHVADIIRRTARRQMYAWQWLAGAGLAGSVSSIGPLTELNPVANGLTELDPAPKEMGTLFDYTEADVIEAFSEEVATLDGRGHSLHEIEQAGIRAGLDPVHIQDAAAEVARARTLRLVFGLPNGYLPRSPVLYPIPFTLLCLGVFVCLLLVPNLPVSLDDWASLLAVSVVFSASVGLGACA